MNAYWNLVLDVLLRSLEILKNCYDIEVIVVSFYLDKNIFTLSTLIVNVKGIPV